MIRKELKLLKFKIGNKVRVIKIRPDSNQYREKYIGEVFTITKVNPNISFENDKHYGIKENSFIYYEDELEMCEFTKSDLEDWMVVELNNGKRMVVCGDSFINFSCFVRIKRFDEDLNNENLEDYSVRKVYRSSSLCLGDLFDDECLDLIWERHDESKTEIIKDMTVSEIEKELGYKIRIKSD